MNEEKLTGYWKLRRKYNTLSINYDVLKRESENKDIVITKLKSKNKKLKEELKNGNSRREK